MTEEIEQPILAETNRRIRRAIIFHSIRGILAMIGVLLFGTAFLNQAGVPRPWQIALSPAWAAGWYASRMWMIRGLRDQPPAVIPVAGGDTGEAK